MLALVVMIDFCIRADLVSDRLQPVVRHRQRGQCAGARPLGRKYRPHPADKTASLQGCQRPDHISFGNLQLRGDLCIGFGAQRKTALLLVQQSLF